MTLLGAAQPAPARSLRNLSRNFMLRVRGINGNEVSEIMTAFHRIVICDKSLSILRGSLYCKD